jgi:NADH:ubiquinone reductase (non-electrogenic)
MASSRAVMRLSTSSIGFAATARRQFATSSPLTRPGSALFNQKLIQQSFRRAYSDAAPAKKPRRFRYFTWLWRATYLSVIGGLGYTAYGVWEQKYPDDQFTPDPTKKNLVILGM